MWECVRLFVPPDVRISATELVLTVSVLVPIQRGLQSCEIRFCFIFIKCLWVYVFFCELFLFSFHSRFVLCCWPIFNRIALDSRIQICVLNAIIRWYRHLMHCASKKFTCFFVCSFFSIQFLADYKFSILLLDCLVEHAYFISHCVAISPYK